jgi:hypothetical protein
VPAWNYFLIPVSLPRTVLDSCIDTFLNKINVLKVFHELVCHNNPTREALIILKEWNLRHRRVAHGQQYCGKTRI